MTDEKEKQIEFDHELKSLIDSIEKQAKTSIKKKKIYLLVVLFCSLIVYFILSNEQLSYNIYFICLSILRLLLIQILPYWNWTTIYTNTCFISNPFYNNSLDISECSKCENTKDVLRQSNVTFFNFTKNVYLNHQPLIIDDATNDWPAMKTFNVKHLFKLFIDDEILSEQDLCFFETNLRNYNRPGGADQLFNDYLDGKRRSFTVHWNNCKRESLKVLRTYYQKPYFLPPSVSQTMMGNWFLVSVGFDKSKDVLVKIPLNYNWIWLAQTQGSSLIRLQVRHPCEKFCSNLKSIKLNQGDLIIYSNLYEAFYTPLKRETILLAQGVD